MERFYNFDNEPEQYWQNLCAAVKWANKSIMLEKLGLDDVEETNHTLFKSTFNELAQAESDLLVKGDRVYVTDELRKGFEAETTDRNVTYERIWKKAHDTIKTKTR